VTDAPPHPAEVDVLDLLPDGVVVAGADGRVTHVNKMALELLGADDLVGRQLADVLPLQDLDGRDWHTLTDPYDGLNIRRRQAEQAWRLPDGTELLVTARMQRPGPHHPVQHVAVSLRSARARDRLDRERSDLVATVAHELRSPLTGVRGFTGTLLARWDKFSDDQKKLIMQSVHSDTDRLTRLIAELLEVARIDTGRLSLHPRPLDVAPAVEQVTRSIRAGTGREVLFDTDVEAPQILADPDRFAQVLTNLVENAVRHGDGTVRVTVVTRSDEAQHFVDVVVEDEGEGIAPEIRKRVFTKFWKYGTRGGSGLGMYIAHGLVTAHGGQILIDDAAGGGARIQTSWPVFTSH
jgi:signal transduction histidine kinase